MERKGIPVVLETWNFEDIQGISHNAFRSEGVPEVREVYTPPDTALTSLKGFMPEFIDALTRPLNEKEKLSGTYTPTKRPRMAMTGNYREVQEFFEGDLTRFPTDTAPVALMTDGLPVTPPTEELVEEMLTGTSHAPDEIVNPRMGPGELIATVEGVAINGVMAGCKPKYMPVLLAMAELGACVGMPSDCDFGHMYVVSGPIAKEIGMNSGFQMLSPGNPANSSITRACGLMGINLGGCMMGVTTIGRMGAHLWGLTFAESEDSPWEGLNINEGYEADDSVLISFGGYLKLLGACLNEVKHETNLFELQNGSPDHLVAALKASKEARMAIVLFTPDTARIWKEHYGFNTAQQLQNYLYDNVTQTRAEWGSQYFFYMTSQLAKQSPRGSRMINPDHLDLPDDASVPIIVNGPKSIKIIVAGGRGTQWGYGGNLFGSSVLIDKWR